MRLVLMAHGSRDPRWRAPFERLAEAIGAEVGVERVRLAYLDHATPTLADVAAEAHADGIDRLVVLPLFMSGGGHVSADIPERAREAEHRCPGISVEVLAPVGEDPRVVAAMSAIARAALGGR